MTWFDQCFEKLIAHEGGVSENPMDPGGLTNYGVSQRAYPNLDIRSLTLAEVKQLYKRDYWDRAQCDKLPPPVAYMLFDAAVNSGIGQAIRFLQRAAGVADDGALGPMTLAAVQRMDGEALAGRFLGQRLDFMTRLTTWDTFGKGWARRVADQLKGL